MSRFFSEKYAALTPYTPGEQPKEMEYVKLNTNESPFPPSAATAEAAAAESKKLMLYSDPESAALTAKLADFYGLKPQQIICTGGSDEALNWAFMAFADEKRPLIFPQVTYGFYPVIAELNNIPYEEIPLREDFTIDAQDYRQAGKTVVIANPNAPTGIFLPLSEIEAIIAADENRVVIIDEAYVDFGGESALGLIERYDNLLVTRTFSKSRSLAGARLGFAAGSEELIADMNTLKYSANPYNVNRMTAAAGCAAIDDNEYYAENCRRIIATREFTASELKKLDFEVLPSAANFLFARSCKCGGEKLYSELKKRGVLVRHFTKPAIEDFVRITIGTEEQMKILLEKIKEVL